MNASPSPHPAEWKETEGLLPPVERDLPTGRHQFHKERLMAQIHDESRTTASVPARPQKRRPWYLRPAIAVPVATVAAGLTAGAALLVGANGDSGPLSSAQLSAWTSNPAKLNTATDQGSAAQKVCLEKTKQTSDGEATPKISNADIRGSVASMVITRGDNAMYCLAGSDGSGISMAVEPVAAKTGKNNITVETLGAVGNGSGRVNYVLGSVGADVKKVTVRDSGHTAQATIQDGRWTAWWPKGHPHGLLTGTLTLTLTDGTTRTVEPGSHYGKSL